MAESATFVRAFGVFNFELGYSYGFFKSEEAAFAFRKEHQLTELTYVRPVVMDADVVEKYVTH